MEWQEKGGGITFPEGTIYAIALVQLVALGWVLVKLKHWWRGQNCGSCPVEEICPRRLPSLSFFSRGVSHLRNRTDKKSSLEIKRQVRGRGRCNACRGKRFWYISIVALVAFALAVGLLVGVSWDALVNKGFSHPAWKKYVEKRFIRWMRGQTTVRRAEHLVVFQHIPRTSGDTLFKFSFNGGEPEQMWDVSRLSFEQFKENLSPPAPFMPTRHEMYNLTLIKGPFSHDEIARIPAAVGRPTRVFTILRDPVERSLSFFALFWGPHNRPLSTRYEMPFETFFDYNSTQHRDKGATWHSYVRTFTENSMTWQLGNYLHADHREHSLSRTELLNRAKQALREMVYVAFFEDMWRHQGNIMQPGKVFASGDLDTLWVFPWLWWVWSLFAWPRSCVRKFGSLYPNSYDLLKKATNSTGNSMIGR